MLARVVVRVLDELLDGSRPADRRLEILPRGLVVQGPLELLVVPPHVPYLRHQRVRELGQFLESYVGPIYVCGRAVTVDGVHLPQGAPLSARKSPMLGSTRLVWRPNDCWRARYGCADA